MSPAEAGAVELEEPDWVVRLQEHQLRWPKLPAYLAQDNAFEETLRDWRRFHFTWVNGAKHFPPASIGVVALAKLGVMPPRWLHRDIPRSDETGYQCDEHMWLSIRQESWRILAIEDRMLCLERGFEDKPETMQIDLNKAKWNKYCEAAAESLRRSEG